MKIEIQSFLTLFAISACLKLLNLHLTVQTVVKREFYIPNVLHATYFIACLFFDPRPI